MPLPRYFLAIILLSAVLVSQIIAFDNTIVLRSPVFHVVMHIAGGIGIGLFLMAFLAGFKMTMAEARMSVLLGVLIFGLLWELFETIFNLTGYRPGTMLYYIDTCKDLVNDMIGGAFIVWIMK